MKLKKNLIAIATLFVAAAFMSLRPAEKVIEKGITEPEMQMMLYIL